MEPIDEMGLFWLADHPDDALAGRLTFSPQGGRGGGINLSLVGVFDSVRVSEQPERLRIVGWIGSKQVTLDDAFLAGASQRTGVSTSRYRANRLYIGHQFGNDESLAFQSATAYLTDLESWVDDHSTIEDYPVRGPSGGPVYTLSFDPPAKETARFSRGTVELSIQWARSTDDQDSVVWRSWPAIAIRYDEMQPIRVIHDDIGRIQGFVSLCLNKATILDGLFLTRPDVHANSLTGTDMGLDQLIELRAPLIRYLDPSERRQQHKYRMLLTYAEVGRIEASARWLDSSEKFQRSLDSMMSVRYAEQMYVENRYLNVTFASEAFHRICFDSTYAADDEFSRVVAECVSRAPEAHREWLYDKIAYANEPPLRKRMRQLAAKTRHCTRLLVGDVDRWAFVVSRVRNELTHIGRNSRKFSGSDLRRLAESVFLVTGIAMLEESGVPTETLAAKSECDALVAEAKPLQFAVNSIHNTLISSP